MFQISGRNTRTYFYPASAQGTNFLFTWVNTLNTFRLNFSCIVEFIREHYRFIYNKDIKRQTSQGVSSGMQFSPYKPISHIQLKKLWPDEIRCITRLFCFRYKTLLSEVVSSPERISNFQSQLVLIYVDTWQRRSWSSSRKGSKVNRPSQVLALVRERWIHCQFRCDLFLGSLFISSEEYCIDVHRFLA